MTEPDLSGLTALVAGGDVAFLVGDGINEVAALGQPTHTRLRAAIDVAPGIAFFTAAQEFEASNERNALVAALIASETPPASPDDRFIGLVFPESFEECIDLGITGGLYARLNATRPTRRVQVNEDVGYSGTNVYSPFGSLATPKHVVLTRDDLGTWRSGREGVFSAIRALANKKHLVSLLHDDELEKLEEFHAHILDGDTKLGKKPVLISIASIESRLAVWRQRGYMVVAIDDWAHLPGILSAIPKRRAPTAAKKTPAASETYATPYKFLDFFTEEDRDRFFGRDSDIQQLHRQILDQRVTLVLGSSGVGKTSLINAGIVPRLRDDGVLVALARPFEQPLRELTSALLTALPTVGGRSVNDELVDEFSFAAALAVATSDSRPTVVVVDQLEEVFTRLGRMERAGFANQIAAVLEQRFPGLHLVFVMRDDFVHHLFQFEPELSALIEGRYFVWPFDRTRAEAAIVEPANTTVGWRIADDVVQAILDDLTQLEGIDPSQLQIVCTGLHARFEAAGTVDLQSYRDIGGAAGLLDDYLVAMLSKLGRDEAPARDVLKAMVTISKTKSVAGRDEIERLLAETQPEISKSELDKLLGELMQRRVIRPVNGEGTGPHYELAHDLLAAQVHGWLTKAEFDAKYARHVLKTCASDWRLTGVMPEPGAWHQIRSVPPAEIQSLTEAAFTVVAAAHHNEGDDVITQYVAQAADFSANWRDEIVDAWGKLTITSQLGLVRLAAVSSSPSSEILDLADASPIEALKRAAARTRGVNKGRARFGPTDIEWISVPEGSFTRGTDHPDFRFSAPAHPVFVSSFYIQKFPVTCAEYAFFIAETGHTPPPYWPSKSPSPWLEDHPVVEVSWHDAVTYCEWFSNHSGLQVRLPTEAEWEKAASWHADTQTKTLWSWGDEFDPRLANTRESGFHSTTPIGYFSPDGDSPYGVVEMCGNTFDWVSDWWSEQYLLDDVNDPRGPATGTDRVARGGSWAGSRIDNSGCSHVYKLVPSHSNEYVGFRMARNPSASDAL